MTPTVSGFPHTGHRPSFLPGLVRREADLAAPVAVQVVLPLLGKELERAPVPFARLQGAAKGEVVEVGVEHAHLPPQLLRRVGVGVRDEPEAVEGRDPPVHRRVGREARLDREDVLREVPVALVDGVEPGLRAERGEPRGPDVGGHEIGPGVGLEGDLQQVPGVEPEDGPPVRVEVADPGKARGHPVHCVEVRGVDQVMDLPGLVELLVDGGNLHRQHEPGGGPLAPAGRRKLLLDGALQVGPKAIETRLRRHEPFPDLGPPGRVGEVAGADDGDALLAGPDGEVLEIAVPAGRARVLGVDVEIGIEGHAAGSLAPGGERGRRAPGPPVGLDRTTAMPCRRSGPLARPEVSNGRPSVRDRAPAVPRLEHPFHENAAHVVLDPPGFLVRLDQVVRFAVVQNRSLASRSLKQGGNIPAGLFRFRPVAPFRPFEDPGLEPLDSALVGQTRLSRPGQNRFRLSFVRPAAAKGKNDPFGQGMVRAPGGTCRIDRKRPSFRIDSSPAGTIPRARMGMEAETRQRCRQQGRRHRQSCSPGHGCKPPHFVIHRLSHITGLDARHDGFPGPVPDRTREPAGCGS